ncbi:MAG: hypothetical protein H7838_07590 [Magnetococcus sp. DMHC-8]
MILLFLFHEAEALFASALFSMRRRQSGGIECLSMKPKRFLLRRFSACAAGSLAGVDFAVVFPGSLAKSGNRAWQHGIKIA